jgi:cysteine synthase A
VKLEFYNPTGSYKDRMALAMIEGAERRGALKAGMRVVEFTGGSTGSSLAMVCAAKGYQFVVLSSDAFAEEKLKTMRAFGAELRMVPSDGGRVTPALFERFKEAIAKLAAEPNTFWTDQFHNMDAIEGYAGLDGNSSIRPAVPSTPTAARSAPVACCAAWRGLSATAAARRGSSLSSRRRRRR